MSTVNQKFTSLFLTFFSGEIVISNLLWSWGDFYSVVGFLNITSISKIKFDASSLNIFLTSLPLVLPSRSAGLTSFPDYLVLHMRKFVMEAGWVPKKLGISLGFLSFFYIDIEILYVSQCLCICFADVYIDVPDIIDISHMRSKGLQHGEELLPESGMF